MAAVIQAVKHQYMIYKVCLSQQLQFSIIKQEFLS